MPKIKEYVPHVESFVGVHVPRADPGEFARNVRSGLSEGLFGAGAALQERDEQREVSDVRAKMAQARAEWTVNLLDRARQAEPGDQNFVTGFQKDLSDYLGKVQEGYKYEKSHEVFNQLGAHLLGDLSERAVAHQAALAGKKAALDVKTQIDQGQNTLLNDPSQFDRVLQSTMDDLKSRPGLTPEARVELEKAAQNQLAASAIKGITRNSADAGKATLQSGVWDKYLTGEAKAGLLSEADTGIRAAEIEARRKKAEEKELKKDEQKQTGDKFVEALTKGQLNSKMILDSNLDPTGENSKEHWLNVLRTRAKEALEKPIKTSPAEFSKVLNDIRSGKITNETDIEKYYTVKQTIAWSDIKELRKEFEDARTPEGGRVGALKNDFLKGMKPQIDKSNPMQGKIDQTGAEQFYRFNYYVNERVQEYKQAGKNPASLFDPSNTDYLGRAVPMFQKTLEESTREMAEQVRRKGRDALPSPSAPPSDEARRPGETISEYRKRVPR